MTMTIGLPFTRRDNDNDQIMFLFLFGQQFQDWNKSLSQLPNISPAVLRLTSRAGKTKTLSQLLGEKFNLNVSRNTHFKENAGKELMLYV